MLVVTTHATPDGHAWVTIRKTRNLADVVAYVALEHGCHHEADGKGGYCMVSPPNWLWWVGVPVPLLRLNLGEALWRFGQWVFYRTDEIPAVHTQQVERSVLEEYFEWPSEDE